MRHYNTPSPSTKKNLGNRVLLIAQVADMILNTLEYFDTLVPYEKCKKKDIFYLTKEEYQLAQLMAMKKFGEDATAVFKKFNINKTKIEIAK